MSLAKFIQSLGEEEVIYSEPVKSSIRVIPPEKQSIRVLPPETNNNVDKKVESHVSHIDNIHSSTSTKKIKLKINKKPVDANQPALVLPNSSIPINQSETYNNKHTKSSADTLSIKKDVDKTVSIEKSSSNNTTVQRISIEKPIEEKPAAKPITVQTTNNIELTEDEIFNSTGTEYSKKIIWMEYFAKAKTSRKKNPIVDRMKVGRFTITPDNKVLLLPDYDIVGKDPDDVLKDKWF